MDITPLVEFIAKTRAPTDNTDGARKNYTESASKVITEMVASTLRAQGLDGVLAPSGRDKQFMGGYGPKGVDAYLSDEKHGLLLSAGTKGIVFDAKKNLKNRYRDITMEALELHKRFPFAVCGHLLFLGKKEAARVSKAFGTVLGEAVALLSAIEGRRRPEEPAELYEALGILVFEPGDTTSITLAPANVPETLQAASYCDRLVKAFQIRNPFYAGD